MSPMMQVRMKESIHDGGDGDGDHGGCMGTTEHHYSSFDFVAS
jgi:hypothetical protein